MTTPNTPDQSPVPAAVSPDSRPIRITTIVWGVVLVAVAGALLAVAAGATIDVELALIVGFAVAGIALVFGSIAVSVRKNKRLKPPLE